MAKQKKEEAKVSTPHPEFIEWSGWWQKCRDFIDGEPKVKARGITYLPPLGSHADYFIDSKTKKTIYNGQTNMTEYNRYLQRAMFYGAVGRTLSAYVGMVFRKPPTGLNDIETGLDVAQMARKVFDEVTSVGRVGLLVDYPSTEGDLSKAEVERLGLSAQIPIYTAESIINWSFERKDGKDHLTEVRLEEFVSDADNRWDKSVKKQYRVLSLDENGDYMVEIFNEDGDAVGAPIYPTKDGKRLKVIPFWIAGASYIGARVQKPPLLDIVSLAHGWYMNSADAEHGNHMVGAKTIAVYGWNDPQQPVPIGGAVTFASESARIEPIEFSGTDALSTAMADKEKQMASLGASILGDTAGKSATQASIENSASSGTLAGIANNVSAVITEALNFKLDWDGVSERVAYQLNTDFIAGKMSAQELTALTSALLSGSISFETYYKNLQEGEIARLGVTAEDEASTIEQGTPIER